MPAGSSEALRSVTARTAPASSSSVPCGSVAWASQSSRVGRRRPVGWKSVPTGSPASAPAACSAAVSTTGIPAPVAIRAASTLVLHAAGADACRAGAADVDADQVGLAVHVGDQRRGPARGRVPVVQAVDVAEQHQQVGVHEVGDQRGEPVVVAEPDLGVATVSFSLTIGSTPSSSSLAEGPVGVAVVAAPGHVVDGQQHLPGAEAVPRRSSSV